MSGDPIEERLAAALSWLVMPDWRSRGSRAHSKKITYTATGLPPGLEIDPQTGDISGAPEQPGIYHPIITQTYHLRWPWNWLQRLHLYRAKP